MLICEQRLGDETKQLMATKYKIITRENKSSVCGIKIMFKYSVTQLFEYRNSSGRIFFSTVIYAIRHIKKDYMQLGKLYI